MPAGSGVTLLARILGQSGRPITQASLTTIGYTVTDLVAGTTGISTALTISSVVYDALQQSDPRWPFDNAFNPGPSGLWGYNFLATIPATTFGLATASAVPLGYPVQPPVARSYQVDVTFVPVTGEKFKQGFRVNIVPSYG